MNPRLSVVVPAAGASQRLGQAKQLVQFQGQSLIQRAVKNASSLSPHEILVVTGADSEAVEAEIRDLSVRFVFNSDWRLGLGDSIAKAAQSVDRSSQGLMILLCDQWRVAAEDLQQLVAAWHNDPDRIICAEAAGYCGPPVIFPARLLAELVGLSGQEGARVLLDEHRDSVLRIELKNAAFDLDTPEQLRLLAQM